MEFRFNMNELFHQPVVEIGSNLIPPGFSGDKRALWDTQSKVTQIVNAMGEASAHAQGLTKPITTADRLRNSEHRLYLLIDQAANNGKGAVTGMLKTGEKGLYVFDREGQHYQVSPPCVLDFYIHESRQRAGFGRRLFEHMLQREKIEPVKMAIDRPSDKFLGFLNKHYSLNTPVKQMNNYVVFDGFFPRSSSETATRTVETDKSYTPSKKQSANGLQQSLSSASPYGRYGAPRPPCSMGQIIHNESAVIKRNQEPTGVRSEPVTNVQDQGNYHYYSNQPAWQATQSVPNIQYHQNDVEQYNYANINQNQVASEHYQRSKVKEPLIPQSFDGTLRKSPHMVHSMPMQNNNPALPIVLQNTASTPVNYQQNISLQPSVDPQTQTSWMQQPQQIINQQQMPNQQVSLTSNFNDQRPIGQEQNQSNISNVPLQHQGVESINQQYYQTGQEVPVNLPLHQNQNNVANIPSQHQPIYQQYYQNQQEVSAKVPYQNQNIVANIPSQHQPIDQQYYQNQQEVSVKVPDQNQNIVANITSQHQPINQQYYQNQHQVPDQNQSNIANMPSQHQPISQQYYQDVPAELSQQNIANIPSQHQIVGPVSQQYQTHFQNQQVVPASLAQVSQSQINQQQMDQQHQQRFETPPVAGQQHLINELLQVHDQQMHQQTPGAIAPNLAKHVQISPSKVNQELNPHFPVVMAPNSQHVLSNGMDVQQQHVIDTNPAYNQHFINHSMVENHQPSVIKSPKSQHVQMTTSAPNAAYSQPHLPNQVPSNAEQNVIYQDSQPLLKRNPSTHVKESSYLRQPSQEVDLSKGYPPQHFDTPATNHNSTTKADRPNSLNIEPPPEEAAKIDPEEDDPQDGREDEALDGADHEDADSLDEDAIEREIQRVEIAPRAGTPLSKGSRSPGMEAAGIVTPGRSTPGLTDQGYFDLKFYHNKLW